MQLRYSYVQPRPNAVLPDAGHQLVSPEALDYLRSEPGLILWVYTSLLNGGYTRADRPFPEAYDHPGTTRRLAVLAEIADEVGATRNQVVLSWLTGGDPIATPIVGVSSIAQLDEALGARELALTVEQRRRLDEPA